MKKGSGKPTRLKNVEFVKINEDKLGYLVFIPECKEWIVAYSDKDGNPILQEDGRSAVSDTVEDIGWNNIEEYEYLEVKTKK